MKPIQLTKKLRDQIENLELGERVGWSYNPIRYAWEVQKGYFERYGEGKKHGFFLGMNPGPWGMGQTGIPFSDPQIAGDWLGLKDCVVSKPANEREERVVEGWESSRKEGSGQRLFGFFREHFDPLTDFFNRNILINYCPLLMFTSDGKNLTPSKLLKADREKIYDLCDPYLKGLVEYYRPQVLIGIGKFAEERLKAVFDVDEISIVRIPHPSPASPIATRNGGKHWNRLVTETLREAEVI